MELSPHFAAFLNASLCDFATRLNKVVGTELTNNRQASVCDVEQRIICLLAEVNRVVARVEYNALSESMENPSSECSDSTADTVELVEAINMPKHDVSQKTIVEEEFSPELDAALDAVYENIEEH